MCEKMWAKALSTLFCLFSSVRGRMLGQPQANRSPIHLRSGVVPSLPLSLSVLSLLLCPGQASLVFLFCFVFLPLVVYVLCLFSCLYSSSSLTNCSA